MKTKLTLTVEEEAISKVKRFAKRRGVSVSSLFEQWSARVSDSEQRPPLGERLRGRWKMTDAGDPRLDYLLDKHSR